MTIKQVILVLVILTFSPATAECTAECEAWSIDGFHLRMSQAEALQVEESGNWVRGHTLEDGFVSVKPDQTKPKQMVTVKIEHGRVSAVQIFTATPTFEETLAEVRKRIGRKPDVVLDKSVAWNDRHCGTLSMEEYPSVDASGPVLVLKLE